MLTPKLWRCTCGALMNVKSTVDPVILAMFPDDWDIRFPATFECKNCGRKGTTENPEYETPDCEAPESEEPDDTILE